LGIEVLDNLIPLVKKGGYFVVAVNEKYFHEHSFLDKILTKKMNLMHMDKVHVYDASSEHHQSMNVIMIFK